jgi:hypothetical protein
MKKWYVFLMTICLAISLCILTGCSGIDGSAYKALQEAVQLTADQTGGVMDIVSSASGNDAMTLHFSYLYDSNEVMHYCLEQLDGTGRKIYLEYNDGTILQKWLLGHGSSSYDESSSNFVRYTKESSYKYLPLICQLPQQEEITEIVATEVESGTCYTVTLDPAKVAGQTQEEETLQSKVIAYTVSADGMLIGYDETETCAAADGTQNVYRLTITLSELGTVTEITLPEIE